MNLSMRAMTQWVESATRRPSKWRTHFTRLPTTNRTSTSPHSSTVGYETTNNRNITDKERSTKTISGNSNMCEETKGISFEEV